MLIYVKYDIHFFYWNTKKFLPKRSLRLVDLKVTINEPRKKTSEATSGWVLGGEINSKKLDAKQRLDRIGKIEPEITFAKLEVGCILARSLCTVGSITDH